MLLSDGGSLARIDAQWFDTVMDPVIAGLAAEGLESLLLMPMTRVPIPRHSPSLLIQVRLDAAKAWATATAKVRGPPATQIEGLEQMLVELREGNPEAELPSSGWLVGQAGRVRAMARFFEGLIRRTSARVALANTYYSAEGMAFVWAARRAGCLTIDVQHGNQFTHPAYGQWTKVPTGGYELVPDEFWCWSDEEVAINRGSGATPAHRARNVGNLWAGFLAGHGSGPVRGLAVQLSKAKTQTGAAFHLLLTPSWGLAESETEKLIAAVQIDADVHWWLRLHPTQLGRRAAVKAQFAALDITNIEVDLATDLPLPLVLAEMDVNITPDSSTVLDAIAAGIPSVITTAHGASVFKEQIARGDAVFADDPEKIVATALGLAQSARSIGRGITGDSAADRLKNAIADTFKLGR